MKREYIDQQEYTDLPVIYGKHAPYWCSLDFFDKLRTIRRVGLFSFLHEILGYSDTERIRARLEVSNAALAQECEVLRARVKELEESSGRAEEVDQKLTQNLEQPSENRHEGIDPRLLTPPQVNEIMTAFNSTCPERSQPWFFNPYERPGSGDLVLHHNFGFYPFAELIIPRGKLRLRNRFGNVANLAQCMDFAALPPKYARHLVPVGFRPYRMRVLFVTRYRSDLYLDEPRKAQDLVLEIRAHYDQDVAATCNDHLDSYDSAIRSWKEEHHGVACGNRRETFFNLIVSVEDLLSDGENSFSKEQTERIRKKCYAEYLDIYFKDGLGGV